jgi:pimeloyl-ACP methyl ester carboxylesterase
MYDLRGHGRSPRAGDAWGVRAHAADLARVFDRHVEGRATVVGHSAGGAIALRYALAHPARVARLVLVDTPLPLLKRSWVAGLRAQRRTALVRLLPVAQRKALYRDGRQAQRLAEQVRALAKETSLLDDLLAEPDFSDAELATVAPPALLCYGTHGVERVTGTGARLAARMPAARLTVLQGGHYLPVEAGPQLAGAIRSFRDG